MKKLIPVLMAVSLVCFAVPALAGSWQGHSSDPVSIHIDKDVYLHQHVSVSKDLDLNVCANIDPNQWAEVEVYKTDINKHNSVNEIFDPLCVAFDLNTDSISSSFTCFSGIAQVNQSSGSLNNQGNIAAIAATSNDSDWSSSYGHPSSSSGGLSHTDVAVEQVNTCNEICSSLVTHMDQISGSFTDFHGIAQVNQSSGFMNNQNNVVGITANMNKGVVALSDATLTQSNTDNCVSYACVNYKADICNSFQHGNGIAQVSQSPGSMNNQANIVSFSYAGVTY